MFNTGKNKGFTLVEVIVVLVILAILAAIMIPSMTGWIDKAKEKSDLVECRAILLACQTMASEEYATNKGNYSFSTEQIADAKSLSGMSGTINSCSVAAGKVTAIEYKASSDTTYTYSGTTNKWS